MISSTRLYGALVVSALSTVIAGPCRPSFQTAVSIKPTTFTSTSLEFLSTTTLISQVLTTESFQTQDVTARTSASSMSLVTEILLDTTTILGYGVTETDTISAENTGTTVQDTVEATATSGSETTTQDSSAFTTAATDSTISTMSDTMVDATTTTESALPPVPTHFKMVARSEILGDLVMHSNGRMVLVSTAPFPTSWSGYIVYDDKTGYLMVDDEPICVMYDPNGRLAVLLGCESTPRGQRGRLACEPPSDAGLVCNIPATRCEDSGCTDLGEIWNKFYLLGYDEGYWSFVIGADDLSTTRDAPFQGIWPIDVAIEVV